MTLDIALLLTLLFLAILFFATEWLPVDIVTLLLLATLVISGLLTPEEAFSGFASEIIVILISIFVLSGALARTGIMHGLGNLIYRYSGTSEKRALASVASVSAGVSAFVNNTTTTAFLLPAVLGFCRKANLRPSRFLIPLAFASMLGGTCTLIGTSTNIAASGLIEEMGMEPFSLFEFTPIGIVLSAIGLLYLLIVARRLLPFHEEDYREEYHIKEYLSEMVIPKASQLAGRLLSESGLSHQGLSVFAIFRGSRRIFPEPGSRLAEGDKLIVKATSGDLLKFKESSGARIEAETGGGALDLNDETLTIVEAMVMPRSELLDRTLLELDFRKRFGCSVLAIHRRGHALLTRVATLPLQVGDLLLLQGTAQRISGLLASSDLMVLQEVEHLPQQKRKGLYALMALVASVFLGGLELVPLSIAFLLGALFVVGMGCISMEEAYSSVEWRLIVLIGGMTSFGQALLESGAAAYLAGSVVEWTAPLGVYFVMAAFVALTMFLTQPMSNAAAALVVLPIAIPVAEQMQLNPRTLGVMVTLAASLSFIAPFEPSSILVYGPGRYRFRDYLVTGFPLTLLVFLSLLLLVPYYFPLYPE